MAARKRKGTKDAPWSDKTRERIKSSMLVKALTDHVLGKNDMKPTQVTAALGLLKKTLPDLSAAQLDVSGETTQFVVMGTQEAKSAEEWEQKHSRPTIQ